MKFGAVALILTLSLSAGATPSGRRWQLNVCDATHPCRPNELCQTGRCYPTFQFAQSVDNNGTMAIKTRPGAPAVSYQTVLQATQRAWAKWSTPGICSTGWRSSYQGTFTNPVGRAAINFQDNANLGVWLSGVSWIQGATTLGLTTTGYINNVLVDGDTEMNNNVFWADNGDGQSYDYESVILHEAGHFLGLDHTQPPPDAVMNPFVSMGTLVRNLGQIDATEVCTVYPSSAGGQGETCTVNSQTGMSNCVGLTCEGLATGGDRICTQDCMSAGSGCSLPNFTCQASTNGFACFPRVGNPDLCKFCSRGSDCSTGLCLRNSTDATTWCSMSCTSSAQCGPGYTCEAVTGGQACVPMAACTTQCPSPGCPEGYSCSGGTCRPTGAVGDRCDFSFYCRANSVCITADQTSGAAFCRDCCQGTSASGSDLCPGAVNKMCPSGQTCSGITGSNAGVCVASSGVGLCAACSVSQPCTSGGTCDHGRCRSSCNPTNPGSCPACFQTTGTMVGLCACADEIARVDEPCGPNGNTIDVCLNELSCVGTPSTTCRQRCDPNAAGSCGPGKSCVRMGVQNVCTPSTASASACTPCQGGQCGPGLQCVNNRCYANCNIAQQSCQTNSCVPYDGAGNGLCACVDELKPADEPCGASPNVRGCADGNKCYGGTCRRACTGASQSECGAGQQCTSYLGGMYCLDFTGSTGGGAPDPVGGSTGTGGGRAGAAGGSGGGEDPGVPTCACTSTDGAVAALALISMMLRRRGTR